MGFDVRTLEIEGVKLLTLGEFRDSRGALAETYSKRTLAGVGIDVAFVQDNQITSFKPGTVRGLHFQAPPHAQCKLVRAVRGAIYAVFVDLRRSSPSYGAHVGAMLSAANKRQLFAPTGFAHGFMTLEPDTEVVVKFSAHFDAGLAGGVLWNDPALGIAWPPIDEPVTVSAKDSELPRWSELASPF